jgi:hypothetical protein
MAPPGGLGDCSAQGKDGQEWYEYKANDWQNHVGYISDCKNDECSSTHENVGQMDHWKSKIHSGLAKTQTGGRDCAQTKGSICGWWGDDFGVCQKKLEYFSRDWQTCCENNEKYSPKDGCIPYWYKDGKTYSNDCKKICLGKPSYGISTDKNETLKNGYKNGLCLDILKSNNSESELREFCNSEVAYKDGEPVKEYTDICGCYYPDNYYTKLKENLKELYPELPEFSYNDKTCFSTLCSNSPFKDEISKGQCPDQYFLRCINNSNFKVGGDMSGKGVKVEQGNNCNIYVDKGEYPFCGSPCKNEDNCKDTKCKNCIDGKCKNDDSVSCSNYSCPDNKITTSNALCVGDSDTCTEGDCCVDKPSKKPPSNGPKPPSNGPKPPIPTKVSQTNSISMWVIILVAVGVGGGGMSFAGSGSASMGGAILFLLCAIGLGILLIPALGVIDIRQCQDGDDWIDPVVKDDCVEKDDDEKKKDECLECKNGTKIENKPFESIWWKSCFIGCCVCALLSVILFAVYALSDSSPSSMPSGSLQEYQNQTGGGKTLFKIFERYFKKL